MRIQTSITASASKSVDFPWHAIYTRHQHEKTVSHVLTNKGFEIFLPLYEAAHRWKDRTKVVSLPLFPCYVFFKGGVDRLLDVITTPGVHSVVSSVGQPSAIPASEIEVIRRAVESGAPLQPHQLLKRGDHVRVRSGPLADIHGILVRHKNVCRVVLSIEMLGRAAAVEVDSLLLEHIGNGRPGKSSPSGLGPAHCVDTNCQNASVAS
jgi:transcription antitermination factor NusG